MDVVQTTVRIDRKLKERLDHLNKLRKMQFNKMVNIALQEFLINDANAMRQELSDSLADLDRIMSEDPGFEKAWQSFVEAEAEVSDDPDEGEAFTSGEHSISEEIEDILGA
ncbi:hypothetical protein [Ruegeria sp. 6PALISEP08]|uniref:hypothetical protein n=1 Tax=Ruegeria sp. 6PALISEP08 TaxID=1225660 RepID=UPI00067E99BA|nr:hypothetical protein [Ruegeria sp. 6PALISEP08]